MWYIINYSRLIVDSRNNYYVTRKILGNQIMDRRHSCSTKVLHLDKAWHRS
jgi:hypothetical protein